MTTVHTPRAAARTGAVSGGGRGLAAPEELHDELLVLSGSIRDSLQTGGVDARTGLPGDRVLRLQRRRRLVREQLLAVTFLLLVLAVTVGVLAMQWLGSGGTVSAASASLSSVVSVIPGGPV